MAADAAGAACKAGKIPKERDEHTMEKLRARVSRHANLFLCGLVFLCAVAVEVVLFNGRALFFDASQPVYAEDFSSAVCTGGAMSTTQGIEISAAGAAVDFDGKQIETRGILLGFSGPAQTLESVQVYLKDDTAAAEYVFASMAWFVPGSSDGWNEVWLPLRSVGEASGVRLVFSYAEQPYTLCSAALNEAPAWHFSLLRVLLLGALGTLALLAVRHGWYRIVYRPENRRHRLILAGLALVCVVPCLLLWQHTLQEEDCVPITYPLQKEVAECSPYVQQFDAFQKGQLSLDLQVDPGLVQMENVYDRTQRDASGATAYWDLSYYQGKYYSYFGLAPLFLVYYPYYFFTGKLPANVTVSFWLAAVTVIALCGALQALARCFCRGTRLLGLALAIPALVFGSQVYLMQSSTDFYYIAVQAGMLGLASFVWCMAEFGNAVRPVVRGLLLAGAGVAAVIVAASRPDVLLLCIAFGIPLWHAQKQRSHGCRNVLQQLCPLAVPLALGACGIMWYNAARFGNPFEFGASFQLTVTDNSLSRIYLTDIPAALYTYMLHLPVLSAVFPFLRMSGTSVVSGGRFLYNSIVVGLAAIPLVWANLLFRPVAMAQNALQDQQNARCRRSLSVLVWLALTVMIVLIYSKVGALVRYQADLAPAACLLGALTLVQACSPQSEIGSQQADGAEYIRTVRTVALVLCLLSVVVGTLFVFNNERNYILRFRPEDYLVVWHFLCGS